MACAPHTQPLQEWEASTCAPLPRKASLRSIRQCLPPECHMRQTTLPVTEAPCLHPDDLRAAAVLVALNAAHAAASAVYDNESCRSSNLAL